MNRKIILLLAMLAGRALATGVGTPVSIQGYTVTIPVSGTITGGTVSCSQSGAWTVAATQSGSWLIDVNNFPLVQAVSGTVSATQSGTWTVQPGNTANTTAWLTTGTGGAFPAFGTGRSTNPANVTDNTTVTAYRDLKGRNVTMPESPRELKATGTVILTTNAETTLIAAGAAGVFHDLVTLVITSNDTVLGINTLTIRDATGGAAVMSLSINSFSVPFVIPFPASWPQTTAANNWTVQLTTTPTVGRTMSITALAVKH